MLDKLRPESLTDNAARQFILAMTEKLSELQKLDYDHQGTLFIEWATEHRLLFDYALWLTEVRDFDPGC